VGDGGEELTGVVNCAGWLWWSGEVDHTSESCFEVGGCSRTCQGRKGRLVRSGDGEPVVEIGAEAVSSLPTGGEAIGTDKMHWEGPFYSYVGEGWMGWLSLGS
jgi:hypothetical protein